MAHQLEIQKVGAFTEITFQAGIKPTKLDWQQSSSILGHPPCSYSKLPLHCLPWFRAEQEDWERGSGIILTVSYGDSRLTCVSVFLSQKDFEALGTSRI